MYQSELALGPRGIIVDVTFIVYGVLLLLFARGIAAEFPHGKASRWGLRCSPSPASAGSAPASS
jgi:hypothetical protein